MPLRELARYPFLKRTREHVADHGPDMPTLLSDIAYARARERGRERVAFALDKGEIPLFHGSSKADCTIEILSYPVARAIVSAVKDEFLIKRYALAEGVKLKSEMEANGIPDSSLFEELAMPVRSDGKRHFIHFADYIPLEIPMKSKEWKLSNAKLSDGYIELDDRSLARLAQAALQRKIESELPLGLPEELVKTLAQMTEPVRESLAKHKKLSPDASIGRLSVAYMPPCMRKLLAMAQRGENISHSGRFALATFLHTVGATEDEIVKVFSSSPDFDESVTRYQVGHVTGKTSGKAYTPPECATMKSQGNCFEPDNLCQQEWMIHPLKYYRTKAKGSAKRRGKAGAKGEGEDAGVEGKSIEPAQK